MNTIMPELVKQRLEAGEKLDLVDVREDEEVAAGMIPGARHIPLGTIPERVSEFADDTEVIIICRSGARSGRACEYLDALGKKGVTNMTGGMLAWNELQP